MYREKCHSIYIAIRFGWLRAVAELRAESTRTYAGFLWWIMLPVISFVIYYLAFSVVFKREQEYVPFLFIGLTCWQWFCSSVLRSANSITTGAGLGNLIYIHKSLFPFTAVIVNSVKFIFSLLIVVCVLCAFGMLPGQAWLSIPVVLSCFFLFIIGCSLITAALIPFCPDFYLVLSNIIQGLMFLSGVIFDLSEFQGNSLLGQLYALNPVANFLREIRRIMMKNEWPDWHSTAEIAVLGLILTLVGLVLICIWDRQYPKMG